MLKLIYLSYTIYIYFLSWYMRKGYLSHKRPAKAQASLRISAASPEPLLLTDMKDNKCMPVAQIGDCACAFEEPQTRKP